jgi:hypothetical protein
MISAHNANGDIIVAGTSGGPDTTSNAVGLVNGHAYNVLDIVVLSNGQRLVKMQNPWSSETFTGDWSDGSYLWTDAFKAEVGWTSANDGMFFMSFEDYYSQASESYLSFDTTNMKESHFLMLND